MDGTPYSGEYHIHEEDDGDFKYMTGPVHSSDRHETLVPLAKNIIVGYDDEDNNFVGLGDLGAISSTVATNASEKRFYINKFVSIDGEKMDPGIAAGIIRERGTGLISDYYPGDLKLEYGFKYLTEEASASASSSNMNAQLRDEFDPRKEPIGISGNIGVQYGLEFGFLHPFNEGEKIEIVSVTTDALDTLATEFPGLTASSPMLLCLMRLLRRTPEFNLVYNYIVSAKKALATTLIYNDMAILHSLGEVTQAPLDTYSDDPLKKPGAWLEFDKIKKDKRGGLDIETDSGGTIGWSAEIFRSEGRSGGFFGLFTFAIGFDEWDKKLLRRSSSRIKSVFKPLYRNRKFGDDDAAGSSGNPPWKEFASSLRARFSFNPGLGAVPNYRRPSLRGNPFDANGNMCKKPD